MIIKELMLSSFGKFRDKRVNLDNGLNIIYGENETGKTTVHKFIEGMFFGFLKPYSKRRSYTEEYDKYLPLYQNEYNGTLKYEYNQNIYRVDRNFRKENSDLKVYDESTGEDITHLFEYDSVSRLHDPASIHMNLNRIVFKNTISIGQLESKTDEELVKEVKESLINLGGSLDEEISVNRTLEKLDKQIGDIGTQKRVKTSPYGKIIEEIDTLEEEKTNTTLALENIDKYIEGYNNSKLKLEDMIEQKNILKENIKKIDKHNRYKTYQEARKLIEDIEKLEQEISILSKYNQIQTEDYTQIVSLTNSLESFKEREGSLLSKEKDIEQEIDLIGEKFRELSELTMDSNIKFDLYSYEEKEKEVAKIDEEEKNIDITEYEYELDDLDVEKEKFKKFKIIAPVAAVVILILSATITWKMIPLIILPALIIAYCFKNEKEIELKIRKVNRHIIDIENKQDEMENKRKQLETEMIQILNKYKAGSKIDLKNKTEQIDKNYELSFKHTALNKQKQDLKSEISEVREKRLDTEKNIKSILSQRDLESLEQFKDALDKKEQYNNLLPILDSKKAILENIKQNQNIDELEIEFNNLSSQEYDISDIAVKDKKDIEIEMEVIEHNILEKKDEITRLEERIKNLQQSVRDLVYIEEEISKKQIQKQEYEQELESLKLAKETIENVSKNIQKDFSPKLNNISSDILSSITDEQYVDVKISEDLDIKVIDNQDRLINMENLSGGTIEQIYFSTRLGISEVIKENQNLPLILDDAFIQYDDIRLKNVLSFLYKESLNRQIIIFTCQRREQEIIDKLGLKYSYIEI